MSDFDWISARVDCSANSVFERLRLGVKDDVERRQELREKSDEFGFMYGFAFHTKGSSFSAVRQNIQGNKAVIFSLLENRIAVKNHNNDEFLSATVTLNDDKECVLVVSGMEMQEWQFRKRALEELLFSD
jgi:hypothetical protein